MSVYLGIDTSNYTTSTALYRTDGTVDQQKQLLPVKAGQLGLRQSDAVFHHVQQLPVVLEKLLIEHPQLDAIGVSDRPRDAAGSYMPCFTVGQGMAREISAALGIPVHFFSHQAGHIAAALYSAGKILLRNDRFLAFHVSGGTTEAVLVTPDEERVFHAEIVARSLDLKGGQAVDRVGLMLGLPFPAGKELEKLALGCTETFSVRPVLKDCDCSLSGVENRCRKMMQNGVPGEEIARYCLDFILASLSGMCEALFKKYGELPLVFAGGVMSNTILRKSLEKKFGAFFAEPDFSADNGAGAAVLCAIKEGAL